MDSRFIKLNFKKRYQSSVICKNKLFPAIFKFFCLFSTRSLAYRDIGKISHGFNFLAYYLDDQKILPSQETIRRFFERASALYEPSPIRKLKKYKRHQRDVSEYQVNESAPTEDSFKATIKILTRKAGNKMELLEKLRKYLKKWACWIKVGLSEILEFETCVLSLLPSLYACWIPGSTYEPQNDSI